MALALPLVNWAPCVSLSRPRTRPAQGWQSARESANLVPSVTVSPGAEHLVGCAGLLADRCRDGLLDALVAESAQHLRKQLGVAVDAQ